MRCRRQGEWINAVLETILLFFVFIMLYAFCTFLTDFREHGKRIATHILYVLVIECDTINFVDVT